VVLSGATLNWNEDNDETIKAMSGLGMLFRRSATTEESLASYLRFLVPHSGHWRRLGMEHQWWLKVA
jgi:hypothetical protein